MPMRIDIRLAMAGTGPVSSEPEKSVTCHNKPSGDQVLKRSA
jgi:hypothetical protein